MRPRPPPAAVKNNSEPLAVTRNSYASRYDTPEMAAVTKAIDRILLQHES